MEHSENWSCQVKKIGNWIKSLKDYGYILDVTFRSSTHSVWLECFICLVLRGHEKRINSRFLGQILEKTL